MITYSSLRTRFLGDRGGRGAVAGIDTALAAIGWRAVGDTEPVAEYIVELVDACMTDHHDPSRLVFDIARLMRDCGPLLDGGLPPVEAYEPAALELLERYVRDGSGV